MVCLKIWMRQKFKEFKTVRECVDAAFQNCQARMRVALYHAEPHVQVLAAKLNACLEQVESEAQAQSTAIPILSH